MSANVAPVVSHPRLPDVPVTNRRPTFVPTDQECPCGHAALLHDNHGCAAFLGAFHETADDKAYCKCRIRRSRRSTEREDAFSQIVIASMRGES
jgi:hypothetical protein